VTSSCSPSFNMTTEEQARRAARSRDTRIKGLPHDLFKIVSFRNGPLGVKPLVSTSRILGARRERASWRRSERGARDAFSAVVAADFLLPSVVSAKPPHDAICGRPRWQALF
jgi:hypothetical protein